MRHGKQDISKVKLDIEWSLHLGEGTFACETKTVRYDTVLANGIALPASMHLACAIEDAIPHIEANGSTQLRMRQGLETSITCKFLGVPKPFGPPMDQRWQVGSISWFNDDGGCAEYMLVGMLRGEKWLCCDHRAWNAAASGGLPREFFYIKDAVADAATNGNAIVQPSQPQLQSLATRACVTILRDAQTHVSFL